MSSELLDALTVLEKEKGISKEIIIEAIEAALISAYKRNFNQAQNVRVDLNRETGTIRVFARKDVVDEVYDSRLEISVDDAANINPNYMVGDVVEIEVTPKRFRTHCSSDSETSRDAASERSRARCDLH